MKKLTRRRKEILTTALQREKRSRAKLTSPRNHGERQAFDALCQEGYGVWETEGAITVFGLTDRGRTVAESLRRD